MWTGPNGTKWYKFPSHSYERPSNTESPGWSQTQDQSQIYINFKNFEVHQK